LLDVGVVMVGQTEEVAPADRKIYALRDVTGTIEFVPFIVASIMSKKIASGLDSLVLAVKVGRGAFMKDEPSARLLAESLVKTGEQFGKRTVALLTDMNDPLGYAVGNWPEMKEAIRCLKGEAVPEVVELTLSLAAEMLVLGGKATSLDAGKALARVTLDSGRAFETFVRMVSAQGGDTSVIEHPDTRPDLPAPIDVIADDSMIGVVTAIDALRVGQIATALGAGRRTKEDSVDPAAGITLLRKPGSSVQPGDPIARLHTRTQDTATDYAAALRSAYAVDDDPPTPRPVIRDRFSERGWSSLLS
jgi:pyrimidine-nucleoside phosphorylase